MRLKKTITLKAIEKEKINPHKIDLNGLTKIVNELNEIVAPTIVSELFEVKKILDEKHTGAKDKITFLRRLNDENNKLAEKKTILTKRLKVVSLLAQMHGNFVINDGIKKETLTILTDLDKYPINKLDAQINKLESIMKGS